MKNSILIVDNDKKLLASLKQGMDELGEEFRVLAVSSGKRAINLLKTTDISVVITDLKMPEINGMYLLNYISTRFPDIPVIVMTAYGTSNTEKLVRDEGASDYLKKPFKLNALISSLKEILKKQLEGGELHNISPAMFLQLLEVEQRTCTVRIIEDKSRKKGVLFFREGLLMDARLNGLFGERAAYEILSWEKTSLTIENQCLVKNRRIQSDLQALILEAMRLKDEKRSQKGSGSIDVPSMAGGEEEVIIIGGEEDQRPDDIEFVRRKVAPILGDNGFVRPYQDSSWNSLVAQATRIGAFFEGGDFKVAFITRDEQNSFLLLPGHQTIAVDVAPDCPRDRLLKILSMD